MMTNRLNFPQGGPCRFVTFGSARSLFSAGAVLLLEALIGMGISKLVVMCALLSASGRGQSSFTVSSVEPNQSGKGRGADLSVTQYAHDPQPPLNTIIAAAYGIAEYQISGPRWLSQERFDIVAKPTPRPPGKMRCGPCSRVCSLNVFT